MPDSQAVRAYREALQHELRGNTYLAKRFLAEIDDHVAESIRAGKLNGLSAEEAEYQALHKLGDPKVLAYHLRRHTMVLRFLLLAASAASFVVFLWLVSVVLFLLPGRNDDQIPFWSFVALGFLLYALITWLYLHRPDVWVVRVGLSIAAVLAFATGVYAIVTQEIKASHGGDWEGYIFLMGLILAGHSVLLLVSLFRSRKDKALVA